MFSSNDFSYNVLLDLIYIFIIIIFIFCQLRLVSPKSYIVTLIPTLYKSHKQNSKFDKHLKNVRRACFSSDGWQGNYNTKIWKVARIVNVMSLRKFKRPMSGFQIEVFCFFSLCFFCVHYFSFSLLTIIRAIKRQRTRINKASNISKIITMPSWRNHDKRLYWIFSKKYLMWSYLVTVYTCNIQDIV